jgi:hypothetical protein
VYSDSVLSVCNKTANFYILRVCLSVVWYEENNFSVGLLQLSVLIQKLSHLQMQSHNLADWSTIFFLSLFHSTAFEAQFWGLSPLCYPDSYEGNKQCSLQNNGNSWFQEDSEGRLFLCLSSLNLIVQYYMLEWSIV